MLNIFGMFWKKSRFKNVFTKVTKAKLEKKNRSFPFTLDIINWEIILSVQKVKILLHSVILALSTGTPNIASALCEFFTPILTGDLSLESE